MGGNTFGELFRLTTFGESHGFAIGGIIDGCPAGLSIDIDFIQTNLNRRRPGQNALVSPRNEKDKVKFLSGIFNGKALGTPISFLVENEDYKPEDYTHLEKAFRPGHADFVYEKKFGIRDYRGGGRSSARETISRVVGGSVAQLILHQYGISILAFVSQIKNISIPPDFTAFDKGDIENSPVRCPHLNSSQQMAALIEDARNNGDSVGGIISCIVTGVPVGLGEPVFDKLHADLAKAMLSINAAKGFQIGEGFNSVDFYGSEMNDLISVNEKGEVVTKTNHSGGITGGISNGMPIQFEVVFKPVSSILKSQPSINSDNQEIVLDGKGRHDPCVLPRAVPIVESMCALVIVDHLLRNKTSKI